MIAALLIAAAVVLAVTSAGLSMSYLRRVSSLTSIDARAVAKSLSRMPAPARLAELERRAPPGWERDLATELLAARGDTERAAIANDALSDVGHRLDQASGWPAAALRISALGALLVAAVAFLAGRTNLLLPVIGIGGAGVLASLELGRRGRTLASQKREALDALIEAAVVLEDPPASAPRRSWRQRKR